MYKLDGDEMKKMSLSEEKRLEKGVKWFWNALKSLVDKSRKKKSKDDEKSGIIDLKDLGKMKPFHLYTMIYSDPLWKDQLDAWDSLPLFFPIDIVKGTNGMRIRGINIHYLQPKDRIAFMKELENLIKKEASKKGYKDLDEFLNAGDRVTKAVGEYMNSVFQQTINSSGNRIKVCYRSYLLDRIGSKIQKIKMDQWLEATYSILPKFNKMSPGGVYEMVNTEYNKYKSNNWKDIY